MPTLPPVASSRPRSPPASVWSAAALYSGRLPSPQPDTHTHTQKGHWKWGSPYFILSFLSTISLFKVSHANMLTLSLSLMVFQFLHNCCHILTHTFNTLASVLREQETFTQKYTAIGSHCRGLCAGLSCCWQVHVPGRRSPAPSACWPLADGDSPARQRDRVIQRGKDKRRKRAGETKNVHIGRQIREGEKQKSIWAERNVGT